MRSTFKILFYTNKGKEKDGIVPIMGRITINGTQCQFSCKHSIALAMWDVKGNCAKGRSKEALQINRDLDNIKAQIIKHYQHLSDHEAFVTAEMVRRSALLFPYWACSIRTIPSVTLLRKNLEGGCKRRKRSVGRDYNDNCFSFK